MKTQLIIQLTTQGLQTKNLAIVSNTNQSNPKKICLQSKTRLFLINTTQNHLKLNNLKSRIKKLKKKDTPF